MTKSKPSIQPAVTYRVANPRGIPAGRHILRVGDRRWFEGDMYDGPVDPRLVLSGLIVPVEEVPVG